MDSSEKAPSRDGRTRSSFRENSRFCTAKGCATTTTTTATTFRRHARQKKSHQTTRSGFSNRNNHRTRCQKIRPVSRRHAATRHAGVRRRSTRRLHARHRSAGTGGESPEQNGGRGVEGGYYRSPNNSSFMSLAACRPSSLRLRSICLLRARAARSSADIAQPIFRPTFARAEIFTRAAIIRAAKRGCVCADVCCCTQLLWSLPLWYLVTAGGGALLPHQNAGPDRTDG